MDFDKFDSMQNTKDVLNRSLKITSDALVRNIKNINPDSIIINSLRYDRIMDILHTVHVQSIRAIRGVK